MPARHKHARISFASDRQALGSAEQRTAVEEVGADHGASAPFAAFAVHGDHVARVRAQELLDVVAQLQNLVQRRRVVIGCVGRLQSGRAMAETITHEELLDAIVEFVVGIEALRAEIVQIVVILVLPIARMSSDQIQRKQHNNQPWC